MKNLFWSMFVALLLLLTSCQNSGSATTVDDTQQTTAAVSTDVLHFASEQEMIDQVKLGDIKEDEYQLETLTYYFRPLEIPEGARIYDIRVKAFYVALDYAIENQESGTGTKMFTFIWYRTLHGDEIKEYFANTGLPWAQLPQNPAYSYYTSENLNCDGFCAFDPELLESSTSKIIQWEQDGDGFQVSAPLWFTDEDVLRYCVAEKVQIK